MFSLLSLCVCVWGGGGWILACLLNHQFKLGWLESLWMIEQEINMKGSAGANLSHQRVLTQLLESIVLHEAGACCPVGKGAQA